MRLYPTEQQSMTQALGAARAAIDHFGVLVDPAHLDDQVAAAAKRRRASLPKHVAKSDDELRIEVRPEVLRVLEPQVAAAKLAADTTLAEARALRRRVEEAAVRGDRLVPQAVKLRMVGRDGQQVEEPDYAVIGGREAIRLRVWTETSGLSLQQVFERLRRVEAEAATDQVRLEETAAYDATVETRLDVRVPRVSDLHELAEVKGERKAVAMAFAEHRAARLTDEDRAAFTSWDEALAALGKDLSTTRRRHYAQATSARVSAPDASAA
jgi:hypothetical protein